MSEQKLVIEEIGTVGERINRLVDHFCKGNKTAFGRAADIQSGVLAGIVGGRGSKPGFEILQKLLTAYPTVEPTWLLFGRGPMLAGENVTLVQELPKLPKLDFSAEQLEAALRHVLTIEMGLGEAAKREADEARERTEQLNSLNSQVSSLISRRNDLIQQIHFIENGSERSQANQELLAEMKHTQRQIEEDILGKHQLREVLKREDERALKRARIGSQTVTQMLRKGSDL